MGRELNATSGAWNSAERQDGFVTAEVRSAIWFVIGFAQLAVITPATLVLLTDRELWDHALGVLSSRLHYRSQVFI